ncbi:MAG TPA: mechanosensitive ion channel family protein [Bryobacteraceae bacterium]
MSAKRTPTARLLPAALLSLFATSLCAAPAQAAPDTLDRGSPRAAVTGFLEACREQNYQKAAEYLDLRQVDSSYREKNGPELAKHLEAILNSSSQFNVLRLSRSAEGDLTDDSDSNREHVLAVPQGGRNLTLDLQRVTLGSNQVWLFSSDTVAAIPSINVSTVPSTIERYLPPFLLSRVFLETPLWKWIVLVLLAVLMLSLSRLLDRIIALVMAIPAGRLKGRWNVAWVDAVVQPVRVILCLAVFRIGVGIIDPPAIARLYVGRAMELIFVASVAWCLVRLVELFMDHLERNLHPAQQMASRTMIRLGRRTIAATIVVLSILVVLQNWGYNTSTLIAGLGVGGIAVALAAQQTIANVFGGVSLIGDHPIRIGEFGKFGDMVGVVEDIGMRSTRVRTLNRTVVSVPNSNFAGLNLENYSIRDKILFNPTFQIKRTTTDEQVHSLIDAIDKLLSGRKDLEPVETPARLTALASASFTLEIFCYVLTADINAFYKIQGDLLLSINDLFNSTHVELA